MIFDLSISELLVISLFFVTAINCALTYFCCTKSLKILEVDKSISKAVNKLRIFDQYILSKINMVVALFYFGISYMFVEQFIPGNGYVFCLSCLLSFILTLITTFVSRLCYCYTCNVLLETKLNEFECLMVNFKSLINIYMPFFVISLVVPSIYLLPLSSVIKNIICIVSLTVVLIIWVALTPKIMILNNNAKKIKKNSMLRYRLEQLFEAHGVKRYELYYWDTSRSKESNAMVSGIRKYHLFVSSNLIDEVTLPELETVVTHEIGHIKSKHLIKMMIGKLFIILSIVLMIFTPFIFEFNPFNRVLFYILMILLVCLEFVISVGVERNYENEADAYAACYNDPDLFASALRKITKYEEESTNKLDELFQSHPDIKDRIENVKSGNK